MRFNQVGHARCLYFIFFMKNFITSIYGVLVSVVVGVKELVSKNVSVAVGTRKVEGPALFVVPLVGFYCWFLLERLMIFLSSELSAETILQIVNLFQ